MTDLIARTADMDPAITANSSAEAHGRFIAYGSEYIIQPPVLVPSTNERPSVGELAAYALCSQAAATPYQSWRFYNPARAQETDRQLSEANSSGVADAIVARAFRGCGVNVMKVLVKS